MTEPLWQPSKERIADTALAEFIDKVNAEHGEDFDGYWPLWQWSTQNIEAFWKSFWDYAGVVADARGERVLVDGDKMPGAKFFPDAKLNFAENLLRRRDDADAIVFWGEDKVKRRMSFAELYETVSRVSQALAAEGVGPGDRVAAYMPNMPETVIAALATASLGAIFSSCSPDFGVQGVLDRFGQIEPKVLFSADAYYYNGKVNDSLGKVREFTKDLPSVRRIVVCPYVSDSPDLSGLSGAKMLEDFIADQPGGDIAFERVDFNAPLYVMYSSGTTGKPKCIVHGVGGTLLQHLKEHLLHSDNKHGGRVFYFTTCGWMMWNWVISCLGVGASLMLYDGSPFAPDADILFDYIDAEKITFFGTSAKYIDALNNAGRDPKSSHDLSSLRTIASTGSPLVAEGFDYVYEHIKSDVCLSSISGGTDILGCFVGGNPIGPVYRGEIQVRNLAMAVEVYDEGGKPVREQKGELVCEKPFPSMPLYFWNDPDGERYRAAYFERFPGIWCHGDFAEITANGGVIIHGRSDATLNPGGVRIGTAEIYRQVEKLPEVAESIVVGQDWDDDMRVVLFVRLNDGQELDEDLVGRIKKQVRTGASPRHVPAKVLEVPDIPRTKSGKIVELAVRDVIHGRDVKNKEALANPEALEHYRNRPELAE
ncbi:MAG: acetoacetate--CoA ligase [Rhodovibrionaceae bacterium]|nr:acetoacetate--CoA ligase [Rhodovibrionaceae bacterium]